MAETMVSGTPIKIGDGTLTWANSSPLNTERTIDLTGPKNFARSVSAGLLVVVRNPSAITALAGESRVQYLDGATTRYAKLSAWTVARGNADGEAFLVDGGVLGDGCRIALQNTTVLGGADTFTVRVVVYAF